MSNVNDNEPKTIGKAFLANYLLTWLAAIALTAAAMLFVGVPPKIVGAMIGIALLTLILAVRAAWKEHKASKQ